MRTIESTEYDAITPESLLRDILSWAADHADIVATQVRLEAIIEAIPAVLGRRKKAVDNK